MHIDDQRVKFFETRKKNDGIQNYYEFNNGYGASVVKGPYTYGGPKGLWEIALMVEGEIFYNGDFPDVKGHLNDAELDRELERIARYDRRQ